MKINAVLNELLNEATFRKGYNDPESFTDEEGNRAISDDGKLGKQQGAYYNTKPDAVNKFKVYFFHPSRNDDGHYVPIPADQIDKKYSKEFATFRQAEKYVNSPYVQDMIKQYNKMHTSDRSYENNIASVSHDPYTKVDVGIDQINLSDKGEMDRADHNSEAYY